MEVRVNEFAAPLRAEDLIRLIYLPA